MTTLRQLECLILDCQTTGMRPPAAQMVELAWALTTAERACAPQGHLVQLAEGLEISARVQEITGLSAEDLFTGATHEELFAHIPHTAPFALAHYAQFERPFLHDLFHRFGAAPAFEILCTQQISKRLWPNLPSHNIRAVSGFFGFALTSVQRAATHVQATHHIWRQIVDELERLDVTTHEELKSWVLNAPKAKTARYEYRLEKIKRLALPHGPGVYRMLSKSGEVLYVGKATSLKSRVNSYFRGQKNRDKKKLELMAQVWDIRVTDCPTPLEAALLEVDEIKAHNPRYNIVLKRGTRSILFYNRDFSECRETPSNKFPIGPFRNHNWIEVLQGLKRSVEVGVFEQLFFLPLAPELMQEGFTLFCTRHGLCAESFQRGVRSFLAKGLWLARNYAEPEAEDEEEDDGAERDPTPEEMADKFERLFCRAGREYLRTKQLTQLLNTKIIFQTRSLVFRDGKISRSATDTPLHKAHPWIDLGIDDFDRMSILAAEMVKCGARIAKADLGGVEII